MICRISAAHKLHQGSFIRLAEPYSHSGEERKTRLRVCIFMAKLTKVTKPSQRNLLSRAVSGTRYGYERNAYIHDERAIW